MSMRSKSRALGLARVTSSSVVLWTLVGVPLAAQETSRPEATEIWGPDPEVVSPGPAGEAASPPEDAIVLFSGDDVDEWVNVLDGQPAGWIVRDGVMSVNNQTGSVQTRRVFRDYQLHLEWRVPTGVEGSGQSRGNSGVYLAFMREPFGGYEVQVLDSYENETYVNGMAGSIYKQSIPLVNARRPPGEWQTYDVIWTAPRFTPDGALDSPARVTVFHNGVLIQKDFELQGETLYIGTPSYRPHGDAPIMLQAHGDPGPTVSYRNIWVRPLT